VAPGEQRTRRKKVKTGNDRGKTAATKKRACLVSVAVADAEGTLFFFFNDGKKRGVRGIKKKKKESAKEEKEQ
jgi:hypothetical protein